MGWPQCNTTLEDMRLSEVPVWNGLTYHRLGLWLSAIFGLIAIVVSLFLIFMHATHYLRPHEQRHIIRILFMVPIYAAVSFLSFLYYWHSVYFEVIRDCYEAFAIASFFSLMCSYLAEDLHEQKQYFRQIRPRPWIWPIPWLQKCCGGDTGKLRTPRSGLTWFNTVWVCVFQYCFIRVSMTVVAVITQLFDRYCLESLNPAFAHIWVMVIEAIAVTIAMYCLIQFYIQIKGDITQHSPLQKITAIKLVIFLSFWQTILISFLTSAGAIKSSNRFQTPDIKVGIPSMLLCIEMALFAVFHIFAFSWRPYVVGSKQYLMSTVADGKDTPQAYVGGFLGLRAILDAFNPWDFVKAIGRSARWLFVGRRHRHTDVSYDNSRSESELKLTKLVSHGGALEAPTAYKPANSLGAFHEDRDDVVHTSYPSSQPHNPYQGYSFDNSPYRTGGSHYFDDGDIGVAHSTNGESRAYQPRVDETPTDYRPDSHVPGRPLGLSASTLQPSGNGFG